MIFISSHSIIFSIFLVSFVSRTFGSNFLNEHASTNYHIWKDFHIFPDYEVKNIFSLYGNSSSNISHSNDFQTWLHADNKMNNVSEFKAYFLGFQSSCSDLVYLPSSISMLNGKIGKWYSDIQVLYLFFPKTTPLTKIQKLPCLEFIEAPKLWTYQQFFGFSAIPMGFGGKGGQGSSNLAAGMQLLQGMQGMLGEGSGMPFMQGMQGGGGMQQMLGNQLASQLMGEFGFPGMDGEMMNPNSGNQGYPSSQPNYPPPLSNPDVISPPFSESPIPKLPPSIPYTTESFRNSFATQVNPFSSQTTSSSNLKLSDVGFNLNTPTSKFTTTIPTITTLTSISSVSSISTSFIIATTPASSSTSTPLASTSGLTISTSKPSFTSSPPTSNATTLSNATSINSNSTSTSSSLKPAATPKLIKEGEDLKNATKVESKLRKVGNFTFQDVKKQSSWPAGMNLWALDELDGQLDDSYQFRYSGKGVHVYLLDSGVEFDHPDFTPNKVEVMYSSPNINTLNTRDCTGHGSHSAGLISGKITGVAKDAFVHVLRISGCEMSFTDKSVLDAMEYLSSRIQKPAVVSITLLPLSDEVYNLPSIKKMFLRFVMDLKVPIVIASGNQGTDKCSDFGLTKGIISVGSHTESKSQAMFSNFGMCSNLYAPGTNVWSHTNSTSPNQLYVKANGTSISTPMTAAVVAMMLEQNPQLTPSQIQDILTSSSKQTLTDKSNTKIPILSVPLETYSVKNAQENLQKGSNAINFLPIIGGVAGGLFVLAAAIGGFVWNHKRSRSKPPMSYKPNSQAYSIQFSEAHKTAYSSSYSIESRDCSQLSMEKQNSMHSSAAGTFYESQVFESDKIESDCEDQSAYFPDETFIEPRRERAESVNSVTSLLR